MNRTIVPDITYVKFKNNHVVYEKFIKCTVKDYEFNHSYNPTLLSGSQGVLTPYSSSISGSIIYINTGSNTNYGILKDQYTGSISGSEFSPYVTVVGLYNDAQELLAVGKMAAPMPLSSNTDVTFLIKWDMNFKDELVIDPSPTPSPTSSPGLSPSVSVTPTPSITVTPSLTPSVTITPSVTPSISVTPSLTPTITPSISVTPSVSTSPIVTPSVTPTVTPSISVSVTPSITPSVSAPTRVVEFYGKLGQTPSADSATIHYSLDNITFYPVTVGPATASIDSITCNSRGTISVPNGSTVYVSLKGSASNIIGYNAQTGTTCPSNTNTYCGDLNPFNVTVNADTDIALTAYVFSTLFVTC